jgi:hypothetical protein
MVPTPLPCSGSGSSGIGVSAPGMAYGSGNRRPAAIRFTTVGCLPCCHPEETRVSRESNRSWRTRRRVPQPADEDVQGLRDRSRPQDRSLGAKSRPESERSAPRFNERRFVQKDLELRRVETIVYSRVEAGR